MFSRSSPSQPSHLILSQGINIQDWATPIRDLRCSISNGHITHLRLGDAKLILLPKSQATTLSAPLAVLCIDLSSVYIFDTEFLAPTPVSHCIEWVGGRLFQISVSGIASTKLASLFWSTLYNINAKNCREVQMTANKTARNCRTLHLHCSTFRTHCSSHKSYLVKLDKILIQFSQFRPCEMLLHFCCH